MGAVADQPQRLQPCLTAEKKMQISLAVLASLLVLASTAPQGRPSLTRDRPQGRNQNPPNTRFFTGNQAIDSAAWGAALGAGTQYFANQVFNPCRNRGGTRNSNTKGANTNIRIFGNSNIDNGILGFLGGFAAATVAQNAGLTPNCG